MWGFVGGLANVEAIVRKKRLRNLRVRRSRRSIRWEDFHENGKGFGEICIRNEPKSRGFFLSIGDVQRPQAVAGSRFEHGIEWSLDSLPSRSELVRVQGAVLHACCPYSFFFLDTSFSVGTVQGLSTNMQGSAH